MIVDFVQFVVAGQFGSVRPGCSRHLIKEVFGHPPLYSHSRHWVNVIYKYGDVEFRFDRLDLKSIALGLSLDTDDPPELPEPVQLVNWRKRNQRTVAAVARWLEQAGVEWRIDPGLTDEYQTLFVTTNHVELVIKPPGVLAKAVAVYGEYAVKLHAAILGAPKTGQSRHMRKREGK